MDTREKGRAQLSTARQPRHDAGRSGPQVRLFGEGVCTTRALPALGRIVIGRGLEADIRVDHATLSRKHAALHVGPRVLVEDLGSANGTWIGGRRLDAGEAVEIPEGQVVELGSIVLMVRPGLGRGLASYPVNGTSAPLLVTKARALASRSDSRTPVLVSGVAMAPVHRIVDRVAASCISVLILGETGAGKEVLARAIHERSRRSNRPLVVFDCASIAPNLIESELFGHVKGAFTGANENRDGAFVQADGGTLLLDEIGELSQDLQPKLLRVLEQHAVRPVGGNKQRAVDVRVVAATHRSLQSEVARGAFRQDLFYRLNGISIIIPPLRERSDEIVPLAVAFLAAAARKERRIGAPQLSAAAEELLRAYPWPGNVRELRNAMERAALLCEGTEIEPQHLPLDAMGTSTQQMAAGVTNLTAEIGALEQERILETLAQCGGNQSRTARRLGISRKMLLARLDAYGVCRPRKPS